MQIKRYPPNRGVPNFEVGVSSKYRQLARRIVQIDAKDCIARCGHKVVSKAHAETPRLTGALQLEVAESTVQCDFSLGSSARFPQHIQSHRTVGRDARQAPVVELDLSSAVIGGLQLGSLKQRRIHQCRVGQHLITLQEANFSVHAAQTRSLSGNLRL
jgi:hypothetical protein